MPLSCDDAELICVSVLQALVGFTSETHWLRWAKTNLAHLFPYLPAQSGYNKRLRAAAVQLNALIRILAVDTDLGGDDLLGGRLHPVECGRSRPTAKRSQLAGWAGSGYCASHSRFFWGLRLHLVCTRPACPSPSP